MDKSSKAPQPQGLQPQISLSEEEKEPQEEAAPKSDVSSLQTHETLAWLIYSVGRIADIQPYIRPFRLFLRETEENAAHFSSPDKETATLPQQCFGFPPIHYALEVAKILVAEFNLGEASVAAVLLYEHYKAHLINDERVKKEAPAGTLKILQGLLETVKLYSGQRNSDREAVRELLISTTGDIRIILLMLADRLFRLRNAKGRLTPKEAASLGKEVNDFFIPLTHKLGLYAVKGELEDLCLKYTKPKIFYDIKERLGQKKAARDSYMELVVRLLEERFERGAVRWKYYIKARSKSIFSIYNKMSKKKTAFDDIYDLAALRIIIEAPEQQEQEACWYFYSLVTDLFEPNTKRLRDWITVPKKNGYQSLQITILGPDKKYVEVQIRTQRMDEIAEHGVAAHWRYKGLSGKSELDSSLENARYLLEGEDKQGQGEQEEEDRFELRKAQHIYVFTPAGEVKKLPPQATLLDFAYSIHSNVGSHAKSGKVNGRNVSLRSRLRNGDTVQIITDRNQVPSEDWLHIVESPSAKNKIRRFLREQKEGTFATVREQIERRLKNRKLAHDEKVFVKSFNKMGLSSYNAFYNAVDEGKCDLNHFLEYYSEELKLAANPSPGQKDIPVEQQRRSFAAESQEVRGKGIVVGEDLKGITFELAKCCSPQYGDAIFAYPSRVGMRIHRYDCSNATDIFRNFRDRVLPARWEDLESEYHTNIYVEAIDAPELTAHIISLCKGAEGVRLLSYNFNASNTRIEAEFSLMGAQQKINALRNKILTLKGVLSVSRA